jgi:hypothetical protein
MQLESRLYAIPYFAVFLFLNYLFLCERTERRYGQSLKTVIPLSKYAIFLWFMIFVGLRGYVFSDWKAYLFYFLRTNTSPFLYVNNYVSSIEYGFIFFIKIIKLFTDNYFVFVFISSLIDYILLYIAFKDEKSFALCILFYYLFSLGGAGFRIEFNLLRNVKSILLFTISLRYISKKSPIKYFLLNICGCFFHITALFYLPMYFILNSKKIKYFIINYSTLLFIIGCLVYFFKIQWIRPIFLLVIGKISGRLGFLLDVYLSTEGMFSKSTGVSILILQEFFFFMTIKYYEKKLIISDKSNSVYICVSYIYIFLSLYFSEILMFESRLVMLFIVGYWLLFPRLYYVVSKNTKYIFLLFFLLFAAAKYFVLPTHIMIRYDNQLFGIESSSTRASLINK